MNFTFPYQIGTDIKNIVVSVDDAVVAAAKAHGVDLKKLETEAHAAVDGFMGRVLSNTVWQRVTHAVVKAVEDEAKTVVQDVEDVAKKL